MYQVKEIFYSLQGEGARAGEPAIFVRFAGCNLWSGKQQHRSSAICDFCDTDFVGTDGQNGGSFASAQQLVEHLLEVKYRITGRFNQNATAEFDHFVILTGGEPLLQLDNKLLDALHKQRCEVAIETNGTLPLVPGIDWVCVSPKANTKLVVKSGNELKLVFPQEKNHPIDFETLDFNFFFLQPKAGNQTQANTQSCIAFCLARPKWKLSLQIHKIINID